jgi:PKD repeat protein
VASYSAARGQDTRTIQADPRFANAANGDFHLTAGSPAIDAANSGVSNWPSTDAEGNARMDDPGMPNQGLGPVTYADRGALEFTGSTPVANQPPVARLTATPSSGTAPLSVTLNASASSDPDGHVVSYSFEFGDGARVGPQSTATAQHTYAAGTRTARVTVTDDKGATATASATVTVTQPAANQPPVARLTASPSSGTAPLAVKLDASASSDADGSIVSYRFDFGDGSSAGPQSSSVASHTYGAGNWTAKVTVADDKGAAATAFASVSVSSPPSNLVGNGTFEAGTTGWAPTGGASIQRVSGGHSGGAAPQPHVLWHH